MRNVSIVTGLNGGKMVLINEVIFKGKKSINWDDIKAYFKSYMSEFYEITDIKDIVHIDNGLPDEYASSKYTHSLKGANAKAKANTSRGILQVLKVAVGKHLEENLGEKHQRDAANG